MYIDFSLTGNINKSPYCEIDMTQERAQTFIYAVKNHYWYQMYIDDLPIWGKYLRIRVS